MQVIIKLKGIFRITAFFGFIIVSGIYGGYKLFRYLRYQSIVHSNDGKQKQNLGFSVTVKTKDVTGKGYLLLTSLTQYRNEYSSNLVIMDLGGILLIRKPVSGIVYDFRQWKLTEGTRYSYAVNNRPSDSTSPNSGSAGHIVILDSALNEIKQVHLMSHKDVAAGARQDLDLHDFILLSDRHYITMASYPKTVNNIPAYLFPSPANHLLVPVIQEIKNDSVVWQWDASTYPEFYTSSLAGNKFYDSTASQDYIHMNSMIVDPRDGNLIISLLNENQVVKISRKDGGILWRLGGRNSDFPLAPGQAFLRQHHATLCDSNQTLLLLDNGDASIRPLSRILEYKLDEQNKKITGFKSFNIPRRIIGSRGSVQKKNGNYIICGGISNYVLVVNYTTGAVTTELKTNQSLYRVYLVNDITGVKLN